MAAGFDGCDGLILHTVLEWYWCIMGVIVARSKVACCAAASIRADQAAFDADATGEGPAVPFADGCTICARAMGTNSVSTTPSNPSPAST